MENNYILPFLWMKGEPQEVIAEEIARIAECGIGAICLESRPHPDFMGQGWWDDFAFIIEECKKRNMKIWILDDAHFPTGYANGWIRDKYRERRKRYLNYNVVNVWGKRGCVSVNIRAMLKPLISFLDIGKSMDMEERAKNELVAVLAYPLREKNKLDAEGALDLTKLVQDGCLNYEFPKDNYRVFVVYETCTDGGQPDYINMMDKESVSTLIEAVYEPHYAHFKEEFGKTIAGFFSDEPEMGNLGGFVSDTQIGNPKMPLPWSAELKRRFVMRFGDGWRLQLPYLWARTLQPEVCSQTRYAFMDLVTTLYKENFSCQLGEWCNAHKVEYIGHVVEDDNLHQRLGNGTGHYFRAMEGQHMAGIDAIGDQITVGDEGYIRSGLFERDGALFHYALAKMGASAGHLDPKKKGRTMCELFGASGWETGVRNMRFILDHLLVRGVNYFVPHAFSMADYPDEDCPPHFYARGNNPQFRYFAKLMRYANRMCEILNGGSHVTSLALLYPGDCEWGGEAMLIQEAAKVLQQSQLEFDVVSADMLDGAKHTKGGFQIAKQVFTCLLIPECDGIPVSVSRFIEENGQVQTVFINRRPQRVLGKDGTAFAGALSAGTVVALSELAAFLRGAKVEPVHLCEPYPDLVYYHYRKDCDLYMFHNESAYDTFCGEIALPLVHGAVYYDGMEDTCTALPVVERDGCKYVKIELAPYNSCVIYDRKNEGLAPYEPLGAKLSGAKMHCISKGEWRYALAGEKQRENPKEFSVMEHLQPVSELHPEFSGHIFYEKDFVVEEEWERAYLAFTGVHECMELYVNDERVADALCPPYVFEVSGVLRAGKNRLRAVVTSTLDREQAKFPEPFILLDHHVSEAAGLSGEVRLYLR